MKSYGCNGSIAPEREEEVRFLLGVLIAGSYTGDYAWLKPLRGWFKSNTSDLVTRRKINMDHLLHFLVCFCLVFFLRYLGFSIRDTIILILIISIGKELCDVFIDFWDLIGDSYGLFIGLLLYPTGGEQKKF